MADDHGLASPAGEAPGSSTPDDDDRERPVLLSGLWSLLVGGLLLAALLVVLDPVWRMEDCPNYRYGGSGSGSTGAFGKSDPAWSFFFPLALFGWFTLVALEQVLSVTWRGRSRWAAALRAVGAVLVAGTVACVGSLALTVMCN